MLNLFLYNQCSNSSHYAIGVIYTIITCINSYHLKEILQHVLGHWTSSNFTNMVKS